tara:strand:+ start:231 stop:737 length:507 start_codon:yes stop_codon:yes gene_type:complete
MPANMFEAPIPGESLTTEPGGRPWEQPPQFTTVEEAIDHYVTQMSSDEFYDQLVEVLEMGVPVVTLVDIIQTSGMMNGKHTVDVGILISPVLIEMIMLIGDSAGIKYETGLEKKKDPERSKNHSVVMAKKELTEELKAKEGDTSEDESPEMDTPEEEPMMGLMARRVA